MSTKTEKTISPTQHEHLLTLVQQADQLQAAINSFVLYLRKEYGINDPSTQIEPRTGRWIEKNGSEAT
jgi:hypothetical protein